MKNDSPLCKEAQIFMDNLTTLLKEENITTSLDEATLRLIGNTYNTYILMTQLLGELSKKSGAEGFFIQSPRGELKAHPAVKIQHDTGIQLDKLLDRFGLNPEARRELAKPKEKPKEQSDIAKFLKDTKKKVDASLQNN